MFADSLSFYDLAGDISTDTVTFPDELTLKIDMTDIIMCNLKLKCYSMPTIGIEGGDEKCQ
jgi:hypothetical protein